MQYGDPSQALMGMTPQAMSNLANPADMPRIPGGMQALVLPPNSPAAPPPTPPTPPQVPPAFQPSNQAPPQPAGSQGEAEQSKGLLGMIRANWEKDPESAAFLLATGAALTLSKYMSPAEAIAKSFMTGLAGLGAVNKVYADRMNAERQLNMQERRVTNEEAQTGLNQQRVGLEEQRVGLEGQRVGIAQQQANTAASTAQAELGLKGEQLKLQQSKALQEIELLKAQIANIPDDNRRQAATAVMNAANTRIKGLYTPDPYTGKTAMDGKTPEEAQQIVNQIIEQSRSAFSSMGVGTGIDEETIFRNSRADPANARLTDEQLRAAIRKQLQSRGAGASAPAASGGGGQ